MRKPIVLIATAALLTGCAGSTSTTAKTSSESSAPSASTTGTAPTAEQITWAGGVCTATTTLNKNVEGLASAVTSGDGNVGAGLSAQMATVKASATALTKTLTAVPAGSGSDAEAAEVKVSADQFKTSITALGSRVSALEGKSGPSKVTALASVGAAATDSLSKLSATGLAIKNAAQDSRSTLGQAFAAASSCSSVTSK